EPRAHRSIEAPPPRRGGERGRDPLSVRSSHPHLPLGAHVGDESFLVLHDGPVPGGNLEEQPGHHGAGSVLESRHAPAPPAGGEVVDQSDVEGLGRDAGREPEEVVPVLLPPLLEGRRVEDGGVREVGAGRPVGQPLPRGHHLLVVGVHLASSTWFVASRLWRRADREKKPTPPPRPTTKRLPVVRGRGTPPDPPPPGQSTGPP